MLVCARGCLGPIARSRASHGIDNRSPFDSQMDLLMCLLIPAGISWYKGRARLLGSGQAGSQALSLTQTSLGIFRS